MRVTGVRGVCVIVIVVVLAACRPTPEQLVELPTLAPTSTPTATPTPTVTPTPTASHTPTNTPTPTNTNTRLPTFTPIPTETPIPAAQQCRRVVAEAAETAVLYCDGTNADEACNAYPVVDAEADALSQRRVLIANLGNKARIQDIRAIETAAMAADTGIWGLALLKLNGYLGDSLEPGRYSSIVLFGGTTFTSLVPPEVIQIEENAGIPIVDRPPIDPPMTRFTVTTSPPPEGCEFIPHQLLLQSPSAVRFEVNGVLLDVTGTVLITAQAGENMEVTVLEGTAALSSLGSTAELIAGTRAIVALSDELTPRSQPSDIAAYDPRTTQGLFSEADPIFGLLERNIAVPPVPLGDDVAFINSRSGVWTVRTQFEQLNGLLNPGETPDLITIRDAQRQCIWEAGLYVGTQPTVNFEIDVQTPDEQFLTVDAFYPGVPFPDSFFRVPDTDNVYVGRVDGANDIVFEHTLTFNSPVSLTWRMAAFNQPGQVCTGGVILGDGFREAAEAPELQSRVFETWRVELTDNPTEDFYIPPALILPDCAGNGNVPDVPNVTLLSLSQEAGGLAIQGEVPGLALPGTLIEAGDVFVGEVIDDNGRVYSHELRFVGDAGFDWRVMVRSDADVCRIRLIEGQGRRLE